MKREIEEDDVVIMNFSGIYSLEKFSKDKKFKVLDFTHLQGTDGYCDPDTEKTIRNILAPIPYHGIHFLDTGNFHYLSKLCTNKIDDPFNLLVFDHHTDLQTPAFGEILSCGGWIKDALRQNLSTSSKRQRKPPKTIMSISKCSKLSWKKPDTFSHASCLDVILKMVSKKNY